MPLYSELLLIGSVSVRISRYSECAAATWLVFNVPLEASGARVMARVRTLVTWARAPSATGRKSTPCDAFLADCERAVEEAWRPFARERPAASSAPELMREPEDNC